MNIFFNFCFSSYIISTENTLLLQNYVKSANEAMELVKDTESGALSKAVNNQIVNEIDDNIDIFNNLALKYCFKKLETSNGCFKFDLSDLETIIKTSLTIHLNFTRYMIQAYEKNNQLFIEKNLLLFREFGTQYKIFFEVILGASDDLEYSKIEEWMLTFQKDVLEKYPSLNEFCEQYSLLNEFYELTDLLFLIHSPRV